jgi:aminoglycoside phosphotransferase (APT) family kinase protein
MSLRHPRYTAHLLDALMAVGPRVRLEGDRGEGMSSSRWSFLAGLELLTARERGGVQGATARLRNIREVLLKDAADSSGAAVVRIDEQLNSPSTTLYEAESAGNEALMVAEAALTESGRILPTGHLKALCDWETGAITAELGAKDGAADAAAAEVTALLLTEYLRDYLKDATITVAECAHLPGGLGKETHVFTTTGDTLQGEFVMRRDMAVNLIPNTCHRVSTEFEVLKAVRQHGLPTPDVLWVDTCHEILPGGDFIIMRRSPGLSGGTLFGASTPPDPVLNDRIGTLLGKLHTLPPLTELGELTESIRPDFWNMPASEVVRANLRGYVSMLLACPHAPSLATVAIFNWLIANVPESDVISCLNHGDVGFHNMLLDQGELSALLDWESAHIGHPAEDLAYLYNAAAADLDWPRVINAYRTAGGIPPTPAELLYFRIMMLARIAISLNIAPSRLLNGEVRDLRLLVAENFMRPRVLQSIGVLIDEYARAPGAAGRA